MKKYKEAIARIEGFLDGIECVESSDLKDWQALILESHDRIKRLSIKVKAERQRHKVEMCVLREEMQRELLDREANAVLTTDRIRLLNEKDDTLNVRIDQAMRSANAIERSIASITPGNTLPVPGTLTLIEEARNKRLAS